MTAVCRNYRLTAMWKSPCRVPGRFGRVSFKVETACAVSPSSGDGSCRSDDATALESCGDEASFGSPRAHCAGYSSKWGQLRRVRGRPPVSTTTLSAILGLEGELPGESAVQEARILLLLWSVHGVLLCRQPREHEPRWLTEVSNSGMWLEASSSCRGSFTELRGRCATSCHGQGPACEDLSAALAELGASVLQA